MILDSNVIIYAAQPAHYGLRQFIAENVPAVSVISYIEVLGYHRLVATEREVLEHFFEASEVLTLSDAVVQWAVRLRQRQRIAVADAIIAGTALAH
ncbi:MAG TPA: type II toxin-antitoxin system VapC family toxin, partial [Dehalococcoidia bacterium]|nr:type II toxin-antitoxin system VapC family toxin [Dehalococcoidia bacterium]